jgi:hypothetical protein
VDGKWMVQCVNPNCHKSNDDMVTIKEWKHDPDYPDLLKHIHIILQTCIGVLSNHQAYDKDVEGTLRRLLADIEDAIKTTH